MILKRCKAVDHDLNNLMVSLKSLFSLLQEGQYASEGERREMEAQGDRLLAQLGEYWQAVKKTTP